MKHIIKYNLFESISNKDVDIDDIKDICLDITDNGRFNVSVEGTIYKEKEVDYIFINRSDPRDSFGFTISDVKDVLLRLKGFLGKNYGGCSLVKIGSIEREEFDISDNISMLGKHIEEYDLVSNVIIWII